MNKFTVVRKVLRNTYRSHNLIGHYPFWEISPRNSTSFTRTFLTWRQCWRGTRLASTWEHLIIIEQFNCSRIKCRVENVDVIVPIVQGNTQVVAFLMTNCSELQFSSTICTTNSSACSCMAYCKPTGVAVLY